MKSPCNTSHRAEMPVFARFQMPKLETVTCVITTPPTPSSQRQPGSRRLKSGHGGLWAMRRGGVHVEVDGNAVARLDSEPNRATVYIADLTHHDYTEAARPDIKNWSDPVGSRSPLLHARSSQHPARSIFQQHSSLFFVNLDVITQLTKMTQACLQPWCLLCKTAGLQHRFPESDCL